MRHRSTGLPLGAFLSVVLAITAAFWTASGASRPDPALSVEVEAVPLDVSDPSRDRVGSLAYRGGLRLSSRDPRFGGLSDLRVSRDGRQLLAVSDCGRGFTAGLAYDGVGRLVGLEQPRLLELVGLDGRPLRAGRRDSESLVVNGAALEVGFERTNQVLAYAAEPAFAGPARRVATPRGLSRCAPNGGIEAMTLLGNRRLLVCESLRSSSLEVPAWIGEGARWREHAYPLEFDGGWAGEPFRPTSSACLPDGDLLVLERRFPPLGARVVRLAGSSLGNGQALRPLEVGRFEAPLTLDNFEGIDVREEGTRSYVYLLSDDNGCAKDGGRRPRGQQRTLLLMFALED